MEKTMENHDEETLLADNGESEEFAESIDDDELKKPLLTEIARKKHFREKAEKAEAQAKELQEKLDALQKAENKAPKEDKKPDKTSELEDRFSKLEQSEAKRQFGEEHGYSNKETDEIFAYASGRGIDPSEAKDSIVVQAMIDAIRAEQKAKNVVPESSGKATLSGGKTLGEVLTDPEASPKDKQAAFEERMSNSKKKNSSA